MQIILGDKTVGAGHPPLIIAELSGNHHGSLEKALAIIDAAAAAGADAVKLQTYTADTLTLDLDQKEFLIDHPESPWRGRSLYALYQEAHTPRAWHQILFERCRELGLLFFSSPFDESAVDFLESLSVPCYKIASFENTHLPLIRRAAATGKPLLISTGMATAEELSEAVAAARQAGCRELILLKCSSRYPASPRDANLLTIPDLAKRFGCLSGLSDHTTGSETATVAVALGAVVIEKHLTLSRQDGSVDAAFSLEPPELKELVTLCHTAFASLGKVAYGPAPGEEGSLKHRRSIYIVSDMAAGDVFSPQNLRIIRPGLGLPPKFYDQTLGKKITRNISEGTPLSADLIAD